MQLFVFLSDAPTGMSDEVAKAYEARKMCEFYENAVQKAFDQYLALQQQMAELNAKVVNIDFLKIQFSEIIDLLKEAIQLLAKIQEAWVELVTFFSDVSSLVEVSLKQAIDDFVITANTSRNFQVSPTWNI